MKTKWIGLALTVALFVGAPAAADTIQFSEMLSTEGMDPANFDSTIDYSLSGSVLTLEVANLSDPAHTLSEIFFNLSDDVTGVTLGSISASDGSLSAGNVVLTSPGSAGGFKEFDLMIDLYEPGNDGLASGETATITLNISGTNLDMSDFFTETTWSGKGEFVAAVKFTQGPDDTSTYAVGGTPVVPEPATVTLLGLGLAGAAIRMRKRSKKS